MNKKNSTNLQFHGLVIVKDEYYQFKLFKHFSSIKFMQLY